MAQTAEAYHVPVLLKESVDGLAVRRGGTYVDVTFGGGGHSREILRRLAEAGGGRLFSFDQDADAEQQAGDISDGLPEGVEFTFVRSNFRYLKNWMRYYGVEAVDGVLADLGVSSHHFDDPGRGFSFRFDAPLDMRMNRRGGRTAADVLNTESEERMAEILRFYGELSQSRRLASAIAARRREREFLTTQDLLDTVQPIVHKARAKKDLARLFQALRIEVNGEMEALRDMLPAAMGLLREGGRISVITYHSLEDRLVKNIMRSGNFEGKVTQDFYGRTEAPLQMVKSKALVPSQEEQGTNPRSRSAKLRIAEKR